MKVVKTKIQRYNEYKDSGAEWLGDVPEHWEMKRFKFLANANKGKLPKNIVSTNDASLPPYMSMEYLRGGIENQWVKDNDALIIDKDEILLLWDGSNSGEFLKSRKGVISSTVAHIIFKGIDKKFAWYHSKVLEIELRKNTIGMGIPHVNGRVLNNLTMLLPPLPEQTKIAQFLDDKTAKIEVAIAIKKQQINLLKERKQILIHKTVTQGLNPNVQLKDSGVEWIGEIPEDWEVAKAKYYSTIFVPERAKPDLNIEKDGYPWVTTEHLRSVELFENAVTYYVNKKSKLRTGSRAVKSNSVLATCVGNFGIASKLNFDCIINQQIQGFTDLKINANYLTYLVRLSEDYFKNNSTLTTIMYVNKDTFGNMPISLPPLSEQKEISAYIETASQKIETAINLKQQEIEKLKEYKSSLINSVVTGKVKVV